MLDADSRFLFLTVYAVRMSSHALGGLLAEIFADLPGRIERGDLGVRESGEGARLLPTAIFARWSNPGWSAHDRFADPGSQISSTTC